MTLNPSARAWGAGAAGAGSALLLCGMALLIAAQLAVTPPRAEARSGPPPVILPDNYFLEYGGEARGSNGILTVTLKGFVRFQRARGGASWRRRFRGAKRRAFEARVRELAAAAPEGFVRSRDHRAHDIVVALEPSCSSCFPYQLFASDRKVFAGVRLKLASRAQQQFISFMKRTARRVIATGKFSRR